MFRSERTKELMLSARREERTDTVKHCATALSTGAYAPVVTQGGGDLEGKEAPLPRQDETCTSIAADGFFSLLPALIFVFVLLVVGGLLYPGGESAVWLYCRARALIMKDEEACNHPPWRWLALNLGMLLYVLWSVVIDPAARTGYRYCACYRNCGFWRAFASYFPVELVGNPLDPQDGPFVIGYHPHGIISVGAFAAFGTNGCYWEAGPGSMGVQPHLLTLPINFQIPFLREILLGLGLCTSAKETFRSILKNRGHKAVVVVVGGAEESLSSTEGTYDLTLVRRKGFVREALMSNASLVPCFGFGETDIYHMDSGAGCISKLQNLMKKVMGFTLPLFRGRCGPMPYAHRIVVVLGDAIPPPLNHDPKNFDPKSDSGQALIDEMHADYCRELRKLWNDQKEEMAPNRRGTLMFQGKVANRHLTTIMSGAPSA